MYAIPIIIGILGLIGSAYSIKQQADAGDEGKKIADQNAARQQAEADESARRETKNLDRQVSLAKAKAAASGAKGTSLSYSIYDLWKTGTEEIDWMRKAGGSSSDILRKEGTLAKNRAYAGAVSTGFESVGNTYNLWAGAGYPGMSAK